MVVYVSLSAGTISSYKISPFAVCVKFTLAVPTPLAFLIAVDVCVKFISCDETPGFSLTPSADCVNANSKVAPFDCKTKAK